MKFAVSLLAAFVLSSCAMLDRSDTGKRHAFANDAERHLYLTQQLDQIFERRQSPLEPGVVLIIRKDQQIIYSAAKGMADLNAGKPISLHTVFDVASVTKPITAIAIMRLVEQGKLNVSDPVRRWLPDLPARWQSMTIHHLLSQQSGIPDCCSGMPVKKFQKLDGVKNSQLLARYYQDDTLLFEPGSRAAYNNSNYILLAEIIASAGGVSYPDHVRDNIFRPLGMASSFVGAPPLDFAFDQALNRGKDWKIYGISLDLTGAFGMRSSVPDLLAFIDGIRANHLISRDALRQMTVDHSGMPVRKKDFAHYGYGSFVPPHSPGLVFFSHGGDADGFASVLSVDFKRGVDVVALGNGGKRSEEILKSIIEAVREAYAESRPPASSVSRP